MQLIISKSKTLLRKKWKTKLLVFLALVIFTWFVSIAFAPLNKIKELQKCVNTDSVLIQRFDSVYYHPELREGVREKAFKEALLKLAENDSIQLVINLTDSTINLSIKGVMIHQTRVGKFNTDKFFEKITLIQAYKLFSQPLSVYSCYATIVKEPVVVRHAPKDLQEAELNAWQPDTLMQNPAFVTLLAEHKIQIVFEQDLNKDFYDIWKKLEFYSHLRFMNVIASMENFFRFKKQEYRPTITIELPVDDLRAIYRALPHNMHIVLKMQQFKT